MSAAAGLVSALALVACGGGGTASPLQIVMFAPITTEATGPNGAMVTVPAPTVTGSAGTATVACTPAIGPGTEPIGTTQVTCTASDSAGDRASGTSTITVVDTTAPGLVMFAPITVVATSAAGAVVTVPAPAATDAAGTPSVSCTPASGPGQYAVGTTPVSCTARDAAGNTTTKTSTVTVLALPAGPSGSIDPGFGSGGVVITSPGPTVAVVVQPDGKIVALALGPYTGGASFTLMRFNGDGSVDASFGSGGRALGNLGGAALSGEEARALVLQGDGRLVVGGIGTTLVNTRPNSEFALTRFDATGRLDTGFGSGGTALVNVNTGASSYLNALAIQPDGKLVAAGSTPGPNNDYNFALARVLADGTLDPGFGAAGVVVTDFSDFENDNAIQSLALQADGRIVAAGWNQLGGGGADVVPALMRFNTDGSVDTGFGVQGKVSNQSLVDNSGGPAAVAVQADGKIVLSMDTDARLGDFTLSRYNADGSADTGFGSGGLVSIDFGGSSQDRAYAMKVQADGRIVVAGFTNSPKGTLFALARCRPDGSLDPAFGNVGLVSSDFGASFGGELVRALAIQADGRIVAAGEVDETAPRTAIARYLP